MKLLIRHLSPISRHFIPLRTKYSPQHPVLKQPQSVFLLFSIYLIETVLFIASRDYERNLTSFWLTDASRVSDIHYCNPA
jgi:hypothetical protein